MEKRDENGTTNAKVTPASRVPKRKSTRGQTAMPTTKAWKPQELPPGECREGGRLCGLTHVRENSGGRKKTFTPE